MLFETVYGPELERVHGLVAALGAEHMAVTWAQICTQTIPNGEGGAVKNVRDAVSFLCTAGLLEAGPSGFRARPAKSFRRVLLQALRRIQSEEGGLELDRAFMTLLDELFVLPNRVFCSDLHASCSRAAHLPLSRERVNAWARVLEYLGLGRRVAGGFQCVYSPILIRELLWDTAPGRHEIEILLDTELEPYVPVRTRTGDACLALWSTLVHLDRAGLLQLERVQDSPARRFGQAGFTHVQLYPWCANV